MGSIYWQLNDIWQAPSWASIEWGGKWKMLHYFARRFFAPLLISPFELPYGMLNLWFINDFTTSIECHVTSRLYHWQNSSTLYSWDTSFTSPPLSSIEVFQYDLKRITSGLCAFRNECFLVFDTFDSNGLLLSRNWHFLSELVEVENLQIPTIIAKNLVQVSSSSVSFQIISDTHAPYLYLSTSSSRGYFSDNGFLLLADELVNVTFFGKDDIDISEFIDGLSFISIADTV